MHQLRRIVPGRAVRRQRRWGQFLIFLAVLFTAGTVLAAGITLCYYATGPGMIIGGMVPPSSSPTIVWAGTFYVTVDGEETTAFCTDLHNGISAGCYNNSQLGVPDEMVACTIQYYPPGAGTSNEMAARQAVVWYFSDNFVPTSPVSVVNRYNAILTDILSKAQQGLCDSISIPTLSLSPASAVNSLAGGTGQQVFTVSLMRGILPVASHEVTLTTTLGTFQNGGTSITLLTDATGQAAATLSHNAVGSAALTATSEVLLQSGTRIDPAPNVQKLAIASLENHTLIATSAGEFLDGSTIAVQKFHDLNRNGKVDTGEPPLDWSVQYAETGASNFTDATVVNGLAELPVSPGKTYTVCELGQTQWQATGPTCYENVEPGSTVTFTNVQLGSLVIEKFHDLNGSGERDPDEPGLPGWGFQVDRASAGQWWSTYSGVTDADGLYGIANILLNQYRVTETGIPEGWYASTDNPQYVTFTTHSAETLYFGNVQAGQIRIDKAWLDRGQEVDAPDTPAEVCIQRQEGLPPAAPRNSIGDELNPAINDAYCQPLSDAVTFLNIWPGTWTFIENSPAGWEPLSIPGPLEMSSGDTRTVELSNTLLYGQITVEKQVDWGDHTPLTDMVFDICISGPSYPQGICKQVGYEGGIVVFDNLDPGDYSVFEQPVGDDWDVSGWGDVPASVEMGGNAQHGIINTYDPPPPPDDDNGMGDIDDDGSGEGNDDGSGGEQNGGTGCTDPDPARDLKHAGSYIMLLAYENGVIENLSDTCSYEVGMASYQMVDNTIDHQELYASTTLTIGPGEMLDLSVPLPDCAAQVDLFYGDLLMSLDGTRYGDRLIDGLFVDWGNWCVLAGD